MAEPFTLLIHSTGTGPAMWAELPAALRVGPALAFSNLGYPPLPLWPRGKPCRAADDAAQLHGQLPAAGQVHICAHSYGGLVALMLAQQLGSRLGSLFLVEPVLFGALLAEGANDSPALAEARSFAAHPWFLRDDAAAGTDAWLAVFIDYWNREGAWERLPEATKAYCRRVGWKMAQEVRSVFFEVHSYRDFPIPAVPCTLLTAERSPPAAREMVRSLAARYPEA